MPNGAPGAVSLSNWAGAFGQDSACSGILKSSFVQRTLVLRRPDAALEAVCAALGLQAKNLLNTAIFAVRQVMTAYDRAPNGKYTLKLELHPNQVLALERFDEAIDKINTSRAAKATQAGQGRQTQGARRHSSLGA